MYPIGTLVPDDLLNAKPALREEMMVVLEDGIPLRVEQCFAPEHSEVLVQGKGVLIGEELGTRVTMSQFCKTTDRFFYVSKEGFPRHYFPLVMGKRIFILSS